MLLVILRNRAHTERRKEFLLIEHVGEHAAELVFAHQGQHDIVIGPRLYHGTITFDQVRAMLDKPLPPAFETRLAIKDGTRDCPGTEQWHKPHHRPRANRRALTWWQCQFGVKETIFCVPERL